MPANAALENVPFRKTRTIESLGDRYLGLRPEQIRLNKGHVARPGALPLACDIMMDQDVAVELRDGTTIYVDIFRPADGDTALPAIISWGPYGKQGAIINFNMVPFRGGVPVESVSGLENFEGPDPAYWCAHGYAVIAADARGALGSEGDIHAWGVQEGRDGHDLIEWVAKQPWSNGKVGLSGTSWLAIVQWFIAAEQPPHLAAIAPCEGWGDLYRCDVVRGGIPYAGYNNFMFSMFAGGGGVEDVAAMVKADPLMNDYWKDKIAKVENITVPTLATASWTNAIHSIGTINAWRGVASRDKWIRVHNSHEWVDYYAETDELRRFFDRYLKDEQNGWESTPRVRFATLDPGGEDRLGQAAAEFPLSNTTYTPLYLDASNGGLFIEKPQNASSVSYDPLDKASRAVFVHRFTHDTDIAGYIKLHVWVSAEGADDLDLYAEVRKLDAEGRHLASRTFLPPNTNRYDLPEDLESVPGMMIFMGAKGMHRASMRHIDESQSGPAEPYHTFDRVQKLADGEIVPVDIQVWPLGMHWRAGEQLQILILGQKLAADEFPGIPGPDTINRGRHIIHTGGAFDSYLMIPVID